MKRSKRSGTSESNIQQSNKRGTLACIGVGMTLGSHITPLARSCLEQADVVFVAVSDGIVEKWIESLHKDVRSLQPLYGENKPRARTYREWVAVIMAEVRAGKKVCAAFYGHPGVYAWTPHESIRVARREGYTAHMEPGISAEDCLYADLGIDPGTFGCQHHEASQLLYYKRRIDPSSYLVVWQAGFVGIETATGTTVASAAGYLQLLVGRLAETYPLSHKLTIYRAATLPIESPRIERVALGKLAQARVEPPDTIVIPPAQKLVPDAKMLHRLAKLKQRSRV